MTNDGSALVIVVEGGMVQNILTNRLIGPMVLVVDWDVHVPGGLEHDADFVDFPMLEYNPEEVQQFVDETHPDIIKLQREGTKLAPHYKDVETLFEEFVRAMDGILGGGDTVVRFRNRYAKLTGKKVGLLGE